MNKKIGLRFNEGKLRYDLLHPVAIEGLTKVLTFGADKYGDRNWENGMKWSNVIASLKRHLAAIEKGEDFDKESRLKHVDHLQANAHFLSAYYKIYPQGDDRRTLFHPRIALDIDGVVADFAGAFAKRVGYDKIPTNWHFGYNNKKIDALNKDKNFWMDILPLLPPTKLSFEPVCYVTHRPIPTGWTEKWIEKWGFPCEPVFSTNDKIKVLKDMNVDIFVDDKYKNFVEINEAGICTYLMHQAWNCKYEVGHKRLYELNDLVS